jgi:hypothetical protein
MSEPTKIYAVTTGSYSDYRVKALFTSKKLAKAAAEATAADTESWYGDASVETFHIYDEVPEKATAWYYQANLWDDGTVTEERLTSDTALPWNLLWGEAPARPSVRFVRAPIHKNKGGRLEVRGSDEQAVKQAFSDNKARILAEKAGI